MIKENLIEEEILEFSIKKRLKSLSEKLDKEEKQQQWKKDRQKLFITGTDCLFLLKTFCEPELKELLKNELGAEEGAQLYFNNLETYNKTLFQFYHLKTMSFENLEKYQAKILTPRMQEGKERESEIGEIFKKRLNAEIIPNGENISVLEEYNIGATPDYFIEKIHLFEGRGILECKLTSPFNEQRAEYEEKNFVYKNNLQETEDHFSAQELKRQILINGYKFQVQLQLLCSGLENAVLFIAEKKHDLFGSKIENMELLHIKADKKLHEIIIECSKRVKKWFEDIENSNGIKAPQYDLKNANDCLICDLLQLNEQASINWKAFRFYALKPFFDEFEKLKESLYFVIENKSNKQSFNDIVEIGNNQYSVLFEPSKERDMTIEEISLALEEAQLEFQKANSLELGIAKKKGNKKLTIKKVFNGG
jgi:hypothetical protein